MWELQAYTCNKMSKKMVLRLSKLSKLLLSQKENEIIPFVSPQNFLFL